MAESLSDLKGDIEAAQARYTAAQQRLDVARRLVLERSFEHHAAVVAQLGPPTAPPPPVGKARAAAAAVKDPVEAAQERLAEALAEYDRVAHELGVT